MRRVVVLLTAGLVLAVAAPAWAHEEITPKTVQTGKPTFLTLTAANEKKVDLTKITLTAPQGLAFGETTREPAGWSADKTDAQVTWTGSAVKPDKFESWGFEIEGADQPGTIKYKVTLGFADGSSDDVEVDIKAQGAAVENGGGGAGTTIAGQSTATTKKKARAGKKTTTTVAPAKASNSRANLGIGLGIGALGLSLVALALAIAARGSRGPGSATAPPAAGASGERQDW
jgi:hypothetical protein